MKYFWIPLLALLLVYIGIIAYLRINAETVESERQRVAGGHISRVQAGRQPSDSTFSAPYIPCKKLRDGKWLRSEIAHWRKDGWEVFCSYWGQELETRDQARL